MAGSTRSQRSRKTLPRVLQKFASLSLAILEDRVVPTISGIAFQDFNANGAFDTTGSVTNQGLGTIPTAVDHGVAGITVTAYNSANIAVATTTTNSTGAYTLNTSGSGPFRVEFTNLPAGVYFGPQGTTSGSAVQFVNAGAINVNLALVRPEDFSPDNPTIVTSVYVIGGISNLDLNPGAPVIVSFGNNAGSADSDPVRANHQIPTTHDLAIAQRDVGTTWGLAYDANANKLYAAAFMKRTSSFGPAGPGAIYTMGTFGTASSLYADLNAIFSDSPAGNLAALYTDINSNPVPFRQNITNPNYWFTDGLIRFTDSSGVVRELGWDAVGKIALGGLDVSADGSRLFTVALADRRLYSLPTSGALNTTTVQRYDLPIPTTVTGRTAANPLGDLRPFAVEEHRGIIYVGAVNSAESTQNPNDLRAYIFAFDPVAGVFLDQGRRVTTSQAVFEFALNYPRGNLHQGHDPIIGGFSPPDPAEWNPWSPVHRMLQQQPAALGRSGYPQPMLTGISFDTNGNITIGLRDRSGDQFGRNVPIDPDNLNDFSPFSMTAGDVLRAFINAPGNLDAVQVGASFAGWTLESNGRGPGGTPGNGPVNNGQGPGGGEFFYDDNFPRDPSQPPIGLADENDEVSMGAVLQLPGTYLSLATAFDPVRQIGAINGGGVRWYDNRFGSVVKTYELYVTPTNVNTSTFAKGNGLGDLVAITLPPPIEVGNFVWDDVNRNGIQDPGEAGLANVALQLFSAGANGIFGDADDVLIATAVTDANGNYLFSSGIGTSTTSRIYGLNLRANSEYQLRVSRSQPAIGGRAFSPRFNDASPNGTARDSNVDALGVATVTTSVAGAANHTFDVGVAAAPNLVLGDTVWLDFNNDGRRQAGEPGLDNITVNLYAAGSNTLLRTTTTSGGGRYRFTGLEPGAYIVEIIPPAGFISSTGVNGASTGPFEPGATDNENDADKGTNLAGGVIRSAIYVLDDATAGVNPDEGGFANLRVDFGLIRPLSIGNLVWNDINNDGIRQADEPGLANVAVNLRNAASEIVAQTRTNSAGGYLFTHLSQGQYRVEILRSSLPHPAMRSSTGANSVTAGPFEPSSGTSVDSTDYGTTISSEIVVGPVVNLTYGNQPLGEAPTEGGILDNTPDADTNLLQDFGFFRPLSLGNLVWVDGNNNGRVDPGEAGFPGITVRLLDAGGNLIAQTITASDGTYRFDDLFPGVYRVELRGIPLLGANTFWRSSSGAGTDNKNGTVDLRVGPFEPAALASPEDNRDNGTETLLPGTQLVDFIQSPLLTLAVFGSTANPNDNGYANFTLDFGLTAFQPPRVRPIENAKVSGYVYRDIFNTDGLREPARGETGIAGVRITLSGGTLTAPVSVFTNSVGYYEFNGLAPGTYTITETQPVGFYDGIDTLGSLGGTIPGNDVLTVTLQENDNGVEYNFGEVLGASVFGYVYEDLNRNRRFDTGEPGIPDVIVTISGTAFAGTPMARPLTPADSLNGLVTRTDANGRWEFPLLPAGIYTIVQTQPANYLDFFESNQEPILGQAIIGNDIFDEVLLAYNQTRGPLNFGEVRNPNDPTKRNFLGSTSGSLNPVNPPPISTDPGAVELNPSFTVTTGTPSSPAFVVTAAAAGRSPLVRVFDYASGVERFRFFAYEESYTGGVRVATGDVNGDGTPDIIAATGQGGGPRVRVFSGVDGAILHDFFAYEAEFRGGVFVAAADVNNDGKADIITGTELGGGPRMTVFDVANGTRLHDFFAFDSSQRGGIRVAAADFNGDGHADLVATAGRGTQTRVRVFDGRTRDTIHDFVPYDVRFTGGVFIAAGDVTGDGIADVITSADVGGGPHVQVFDGRTAVSLYSFFADDPAFRGGVRIAVQNVDGDSKDEIITGTGPGSPARIRIWKDGSPIEEFYAFDGTYTGGVYVG